MAYFDALWAITDVQNYILSVIALIIVAEIIYIIIDRFIE